MLKKISYLASFSLMLFALLFVSNCASKTPPVVAATTAHNGTILVDAVDKVQDFIISEEKAGHIPTAQAVVAMKGIGRALDAGKKVPPYLDRLAAFSPTDPGKEALLAQIRDALQLVSTEVGQSLLPIQDPVKRQQAGEIAGEVNKTIGIIYGWILGVK